MMELEDDTIDLGDEEIMEKEIEAPSSE